MKIILKEEVDNLGLAGDIVDVADGYGRNFLIPRGKAILATFLADMALWLVAFVSAVGIFIVFGLTFSG